jgi:antitoxin (DNA-binding transcriptional repressor) of toxin-antitoxin stability system
MLTIPIQDLAQDFLYYWASVQKGEKILVTDNNQVIAEINPHQNIELKEEAKSRPFGLAKGEFTVPNDFNEPLPDDVINDFYK